MNLFLPEIGSQLQLTKDWNFILYSEYRNESMIKKIGGTFSWSKSGAKNYLVTIPKDTILTVDRVYIRKGVSDFSSLTFRIPKDKNKKHIYAGVRFWAKLSDVNKIEFELISCNEKTLELIRNIDEKSKEVLDSLEQSFFMKTLLGGKTINNIRTMDTPEHFLLRLNDAMAELKKKYHYSETAKNIDKNMIQFIRAYKIYTLFGDDEEVIQ
jgi:hypothetical protein